MKTILINSAAMLGAAVGMFVCAGVAAAGMGYF